MIKKNLIKIVAFILITCGTVLTGFGQLSFTANGTQTIDFSTTISGVNNGTFDGSGFTPTPAVGQLDSDAFAITGFSDGNLAFGGTQTTGDFARGGTTGSITTGGIYAYTTNPAIYIQPGGSDFTPGDITLRIQNNGTTNIQQFTISYDILVFNDTDRANSFNFSFSSDNVTYSPVGAADFTSTETADGVPMVTTVGRGPIVISGLSITPGAFFYLRWTGDDVSGAGNRDEFGIDNIAVTAQFQPTAAPGTVQGRARTADGQGLKFVVIMLSGGNLPEPIYATTNHFGYYRFTDIPVGQSYVLQATSGRYRFQNPSRLINLDESITDEDFISEDPTGADSKRGKEFVQRDISKKP